MKWLLFCEAFPVLTFTLYLLDYHSFIDKTFAPSYKSMLPLWTFYTTVDHSSVRLVAFACLRL